jgi:WD40 repeat protein
MFSLPHDALVSCALFSPDGQELATASYDGEVRIWDLASRRVVKTLVGFDQQFGWRYIAFSPEGKWLAGMRRGQLTVWERASSEEVVRFSLAVDARVIDFTPDSSRLLAWGEKGLLVVDTGSWQSVTLQTKLRPGSYPALAIDRTGKMGKLVALAHEREWAIEVWDLDAQAPARFFNFEGQTGNAFVSLAWSPDGLLAAATWAGRLLLLNGRTGQELAATPAHLGSVFGLSFSPDAKLLVTAGHDQVIHFWSVPKLENLATLRGHRDEIWSLGFSRDAKLLCTAGKDGTAKIWSTSMKPGPVYIPNWIAGEFSADGKSFVTLSDPVSEFTLDFWDVDNPGTRTTKTLPVIDVTNINTVVMSRDARMLGLGRKDGSAEVWSVETGKLLHSRVVQGAGVTAMTFSERDRTVALGTDQGALELWHLKTGQVSPVGDKQIGLIAGIGYWLGDRFLEFGVKGLGRNVVLDLKARCELTLPVAPMDPFLGSPDGTVLAGSSTNYLVKLWDLPGLRERAVLKGHRWTIPSLAFSPDSKVLATGSLDAVARLWDVKTGLELCQPLRGHLQGVTALAFSPDGRALATGSTDNTVKLWHVLTGRELFSITDASQPRFSPDGNTLLLRTSLGSRLIHVPTLAEIDTARNGDSANLTTASRE